MKATHYGMWIASAHLGSRTVLTRTGFVPTGETVLSGLPGITYRSDLTPVAP